MDAFDRADWKALDTQNNKIKNNTQKNTMKSDIDTLKDLLNQASNICEENIDRAHNIDLHSLMEVLDDYWDELDAIGKFEVYEDLTDDEY